MDDDQMGVFVQWCQGEREKAQARLDALESGATRTWRQDEGHARIETTHDEITRERRMVKSMARILDVCAAIRELRWKNEAGGPDV